MDSLGAVEETKASGEPEASLIYEHPEHEDGLVAEAQRVFYPLEVGKLDGIQKEQPVQEEPGEAEIQQDKIIKKMKALTRIPTVNSRTEKNRNAFLTS